MSHELISCCSPDCTFSINTDHYVLNDVKKGIFARGIASKLGHNVTTWPKEILAITEHHRQHSTDSLDHHRNYVVTRKDKIIGSIFVSEATISWE